MRRSFLCLATTLLTCHWVLGQANADNGRMVMVNGRQMHVRDLGRGQPTVVFEAGFVNDLRSWAKVQAEVAKSCTTISYDRAGLGLSQESPLPRSGEQIAIELHTLLSELGIKPPYVLVGHSAGGLYIRSFAHRYPEEIGGMVFVDAVLPEYLNWLQENDSEHWQQLEKIGMDSGSVVRAQWLGIKPTLTEVEKSGPLPRVPVAILVSNQPDLPFKPPTAMSVFVQTQRSFKEQLPGAGLEIIAAGHELPSLAPDLVTAAILRVVNSQKAQTPK